LSATPSSLPAAFRRLAALRVLNVVAVGSALAAMTGAIAAKLEAFFSWTSLPTLAFGIVAAILFRSPRMVGRSKVPLGFVAAVPLALSNAAVAGGVTFRLMNPNSSPAGVFLGGALLGVTYGAVCWIPGLVLTLVCFGAPSAAAQRLATQGLSGEEEGERLVGLISAVIAGTGAGLFAEVYQRAREGDVLTIAGNIAVAVLGATGVLTGAVAATLAHRREKIRAKFVRKATAGFVEGYRVDVTAGGKTIVRVSSAGDTYRVAGQGEAIYALDARGKAVRPLVAPGARGAPPPQK
jgi:hypothetical protein